MKIKSFAIISALFLVLLIIPGASYAQTWCHTFNKNLGVADSGSIDVAYLHVALLSEGISYGNDGLIAYSDGTIAGVIVFQEKYASEILAPWGLTKGTGYVGTTTRAKLNQLYGCSSSSGNSGTPTCAVNWQCTNWGNCYSNQQIRVCTDYNFCGTTSGKPVETQSCASSTCAPSWQCTGWSACSGGQQTKTCTDYNFCGTTSGKPATTQFCSSTNTNNTNNTNTCQATCITQTDGVYAIDCYGNPTKCSSTQICEKTFDTSYNYSSGYVQTIQTLTGAHCAYSSSSNTNNTSCTPNWQCAGWGACYNGYQTQTCTDYNFCGTTYNKPATSRSCCTEDWECGNWSACANNQQTRTCADLNSCGIATKTESQYCCVENWDCGDWSSCNNEQQTKTCVDLNNCGTTLNKPATSQYCCEPNWFCSLWGVCSAYGQQTRTCADSNSCGTPEGKPETTRSCACVEKWQCGAFSACYNSQQTRFCYDANHCGTTTNKPYTKQSCTSTCSPNYVCSQQPACKNSQIQSYCYDLNACFSQSEFRICAF
ncbi:MAG: hypothetical protein A2402_04135 [Candidatus Staskawiczbacteria bacterium RIFOXYC1_FULL_37_43]|nr:MAG: hypothetical protein A2813_00395 [Candidatus Staskawiczbacteria bacterium RIFCSPHIGHO2_01_FULL_37_17]OGZ71141.1 MAG: hypothetical protein A2891_01080 [Candidatus Staskawiczbacteria bacterium RIFCSPLOWO2_01_FULL_37_19]OGZ75821.1 MAG: hypothetical protein A2205_03055 [Candidatus Staskawiczbacteria bacterium RIFOXYA1_FULL_37_15]OGZ77668.1 MAG: hypothetical protein A2280_02510 [Candidatus Staskawiczbacteria bacterium RIFOXYA12_FULL_37_10]OGZ80711.1 MAG: hypothetical protein A2353_00735 [Can